MTDEIKIVRTGDRPLVFEGEILAKASSNYDRANRWHEIAVYRCGDQFVAAVEWCTQWQGEIGHSSAAVLADEKAIVAWLREIDPIAHLVGFPPGQAYVEKQKRVEREITSRYLRALTEVLGALGPERLES